MMMLQSLVVTQIRHFDRVSKDACCCLVMNAATRCPPIGGAKRNGIGTSPLNFKIEADFMHVIDAESSYSTMLAGHFIVHVVSIHPRG